MSVNRLSAIAFVCVLVAVSSAEARKFSFGSERFSSYFGGTYGLSRAGNSAFEGTHGNDVSVDKTVPSNATGEFGFMLALKTFNLRIGGELLIPRAIEEVKGSNASGTEYFTMSSKGISVVPTAAVELVMVEGPASRILVGAGFGWITISIDNQYEFTAAGRAHYGGIDDYLESGKGSGALYSFYTGYEMHFTDTTTLLALVGYREGRVRSMVSTREVETLQGTQVNGTPWVNQDGTDRTIDLSGPYLGISFRFYL